MKLTPFNPSPFKVEADLKINNDSITASFEILGNIEDIDLSFPKSELKRIDELWKYTCFEFFLKKKKSNEYIECNFNLNAQWNLYHFDDYRKGMGEFLYNLNPAISYSKMKDALKVSITFEEIKYDFDKFSLNCILNDEDSSHFFAPIHPSENPDFHNFKGFEKK